VLRFVHGESRAAGTREIGAMAGTLPAWRGELRVDRADGAVSSSERVWLPRLATAAVAVR